MVDTILANVVVFILIIGLVVAFGVNSIQLALMKMTIKQDTVYEINKEIVFATEHLSDDDVHILEETVKNPLVSNLIVENSDYGFRVYTDRELYSPENIAKRVLKGNSEMSNDFWKIVGIAVQHKCKWIVFDTDMYPYPDLPVYDW